MEDNRPNDEDYEIYFPAREQDEETEEDMSFDSFSESNDSLEHSRQESDEHQNHESQQTDQQNNIATGASNERRISYDRNLPTFHSYLGNDFEELTGRVILEEESIVEIPLLCLPNVVLVPGQLLPLQFQGSYFLQTINNIIAGNKIFGLVPNYINRDRSPLKNNYTNVKLERLGTIVEVRSYGLENDASILKIKAEGKERFLIKETWTLPNRTVMGKVFILPEIKSKHPFYQDLGLSNLGGSRHNKLLLPACTSYPNFAYDLYDPEYLMDKIRGHLNQWASLSTNSTVENDSSGSRRNVYENLTVQRTTGTNQPSQATVATSSTQSNNDQTSSDQSNNAALNRTINSAQEPTTNEPEPISLNTTRTIVTRIVPVNDSDEEDEEDEDSEEHGFKAYAPSSPLEFSYWVLANLPLEDHQRLILLSLNSPIQRLRWQSSFFEKYLSLSCLECNISVCQCEDIFSMSVKGYQDVFVNSYGQVHETLTIRKVKNENISLDDRKSSKFSWFPNYSWIIMSCVSGHHLGWKFVANNKNLNPQFFFGISRKTVKPSIDTMNGSIEIQLPSSKYLVRILRASIESDQNESFRSTKQQINFYRYSIKIRSFLLPTSVVFGCFDLIFFYNNFVFEIYGK